VTRWRSAKRPPRSVWLVLNREDSLIATNLSLRIAKASAAMSVYPPCTIHRYDLHTPPQPRKTGAKR